MAKKKSGHKVRKYCTENIKTDPLFGANEKSLLLHLARIAMDKMYLSASEGSDSFLSSDSENGRSSFKAEFSVRGPMHANVEAFQDFLAKHIETKSGCRPINVTFKNQVRSELDCGVCKKEKVSVENHFEILVEYSMDIDKLIGLIMPDSDECSCQNFYVSGY